MGGIMGALIYDGTEVEFDDRLLAHLHVVIVQKLRRGESFCFSWRDPHGVGGGRSSLWLHPSIPLYFKFYGSKQPSINREWIQALTLSSNSSQGLVVTPEGEPAFAGQLATESSSAMRARA
jgi:hypothetical protein